MIETFVKSRQTYNSSKKVTSGNAQQANRFSNVNASNNSSSDIIDKPTINQFLKCFDQSIKEMNKVYKLNKEQFLNDMNSFNENEIQQEEEMIEKSMNQGPVAITPRVADSKEQE